MFKTIMWQYYGVLGAAPLVGFQGATPLGGVQGAAPLAGSGGSAPGGGPAGQSAGATVNLLPCLISVLTFKILNVNEISQSNYEFLNLFKTYQNIQLKTALS